MPKNPILPRDLVDRALALASFNAAGDLRKMEAWQRHLFLREDYVQLIVRRIAGTHYDAHTIQQLADWTDASLNLPLDVLNEICVVWDKPCKRYVQDATDEQNEALAKLYRETLKFDRIAPELNRAAFFLNEAVVVPRVINGTVRLDTLLPHFYDTIEDEEDPMGRPWAYVYTLRDSTSDMFRDYTENEMVLRFGDAVVLDGNSWRRFKRGTAELVSEDKHGLGFNPGVPLRFDEPLDGDRWSNYRKHRRIYDSGIKVSVADTQMSWVRKSQNKKLLAAIGMLPKEMDDKQTVHPETGVALPTDEPGSMSLQALDFDTDPAGFIRQIAFYYETTAKSYGGSSSVGLGEGGSLTANIEFSYDAQTELREKQIPYARSFEKDLCISITEVMRAANHPMALDLPSKEQIEEGFAVDFGRLSRKFASVDDEIKYFDFQKENGVVNQTDLFDRTDPELTAEQRKEKIEKNLEITADFHDIAAARNMPMGPDGEIQTLPQIQGALGPQMRDGKPPAKKNDSKDAGRQRDD